MSIRFCAAGSFLFAVLLSLPNLQAQSSATLTGTLTDPSGAAISEARITVQPLGTRNANSMGTRSDAQGRYALTLPPGKYRVRVTQASFASVEREFSLSAGEKQEWNVRLELARLAATVVVTAAAEPEPAQSTPSPVTILTRQEIENRQEIWLGPLLSSTAGVSLSQNGPYGGLMSLFLDGGNSTFTKVLVDGTPVNSPGGDIDFSNLDVDNIDKIEIVHGASSALFGSDAMTGVVQIFTHRGTTATPQLTLLGEGGGFYSGRGMGELSGLAGRFDYSASTGYFSTDGQGPFDQFKDRTQSGSFGWKFTDSDHLRLSLRNAASDAGLPGQTFFFPPAPGQGIDSHDFSANLSWDFTTGQHWQHRLSGTEARIFQLSSFPGGEAVNLFNRAGFEEQSSYLFRHGAVSLGYQYEVENGSSSGPHVRRNNQAGYLETRFQFGRRLTATAGARAEANAAFGTRVVPRLGFVYALRFGNGFWGATRLRTSYGLGIKEPEFFESFSSDPCFPGNPNLRPERSRTFDAGIDQFLGSDRVRLTATFFHNRFYDLVSFASCPPPEFGPCPLSVPPNCPPQEFMQFGFGTFFNTDLARAYGANATIEARPAHWLRIIGNYTYDDSRVLKAPNAFDPAEIPGNRLLRRPLNSANLIFNAALPRMNWNLAGTFVGRRTDSDFDSFVSNSVCTGFCIHSNPSFFRLDLATQIDLGRGLTALSRVGNLLDRHYQEAVGYPALGFNYLAGLKYTWGKR